MNVKHDIDYLDRNSKFEHFSRQLERIGIERRKNLEEKWDDVYDCHPDFGFRHRDFKIQFENSADLEKALGRKFRNRLVQLAGLVGYFGSFCRNYTESKKTEVGQGADALLAPVKETVASFEDILNNNQPYNNISDTSTYTSIATKLDFEDILNNNQPYNNISDTSTYTSIATKLDFEDRPSIVAVPQTSKALLGIYRTRRAVQQAVKYALACGLVQCVNDNYAYGKKGHIAKKYAWNKVCEHQLRELMKKHGILIPSVSRDSELPPYEKPEASDDVQQLYYKVRLGKGMRTPGLTEQQVSQILSYKHRNVLEPFLDRLAYVNEGRAEAEKLNFRFNVRITNGFNVKNGCRAYSLAGGLVKESRKTDPGEESFEEYFRRTRNDEPVEYDVKGSVPRINRLCDSGIWDDWDVDPYAEMFPGFCSDPARRKIAKATYMLYEFEQSGLKIKSAVARKCPEFVKSEGEEEIRQTMEYWYEGVWKWQGDSLGSLAFLYEDAAYSVVDAALKKLGYDFIRKFDCWVFPKGRRPAEKDFHELVRDCVLSWRRGEYEAEREELEFLENAGIRELKKHVFYKKENKDMNRGPVRMGGAEKHSHPARKGAKPAGDLPPFDQREDMCRHETGDGKAHWVKTGLRLAEKRKDSLLFDTKAGELVVTEKCLKNDARAARNIVKAVKEGVKVNVQYFFASGGTRFCMKVLDDRQAEACKLDAWREARDLKDGFSQADPWKA